VWFISPSNLGLLTRFLIVVGITFALPICFSVDADRRGQSAPRSGLLTYTTQLLGVITWLRFGPRHGRVR
jgi:hypothetical protein